MANKKFWLGILALVLVFGMTVVGCDNDPSGDTWSNVISFSQVNGSWKAPSTTNGNIMGIKVTISSTNYIITFNASTKTMSASGTRTETYSGGSIDTLWPSIKATALYMGQQEGVNASANDANHSITMTYNDFSHEMTDAELLQMEMQINQNGSKLKFSSGGLEIVYIKQ